MSVDLVLRNVLIIGKNNIVMIVKVVKYANIIVENQIVKSVKSVKFLNCVFII